MCRWMGAEPTNGGEIPEATAAVVGHGGVLEERPFRPRP
jgi:hypothetical protein